MGCYSKGSLNINLNIKKMKTLCNSLFEAIEQNQLSKVKNLIENKNVDVNSLDISSFKGKDTEHYYPRGKLWTPLLLATSLRRTKISRYLLEKGASTTDILTDGRGYEYFLAAIKYANEEIKFPEFSKFLGSRCA